MNVEITEHQLTLILQNSAKMAAIIVLAKLGRIKVYLKKSEAFRLYGRANVEHWIEKGLITARKDGDHSAGWRVDRTELEALQIASEIARYF